MLTIEEALQLVQDKWQSVNSPGTIRKKDTYIKRFRLMAEEKGFEFPCQEFYDMFMESAVKTGSQDIITNHCNLVRTMDEVSKTGAIDRHGKPYNETFRCPDAAARVVWLIIPILPEPLGTSQRMTKYATS